MEHVHKKKLGFFDRDMLQLFEFESFLFRSYDSSGGQALLSISSEADTGSRHENAKI
jgi:hypothetical protein